MIQCHRNTQIDAFFITGDNTVQVSFDAVVDGAVADWKVLKCSMVAKLDNSPKLSDGQRPLKHSSDD